MLINIDDIAPIRYENKMKKGLDTSVGTTYDITTYDISYRLSFPSPKTDTLGDTEDIEFYKD